MMSLSASRRFGAPAIPFSVHTGEERAAMLKTIGVENLSDLFCDIPSHLLLENRDDGPSLPSPKSEHEVLSEMKVLAGKNSATTDSHPAFLAGGCHVHYIPTAVDAITSRSEFLTAYTPYQPEVSQGTLQSLFEYQSIVCALTGMETSNATLYDASTGTAEAVLMAVRAKRKRRGVVVAPSVHPHYRDVLSTYAKWGAGDGLALDLPAPADAGMDLAALAARVDKDTACVVVQVPDVFGNIADVSGLAEACHKAGALLVMVCPEPLALTALPSVAAMGVDIFVGEGQGLAAPPSFGGPSLGILATTSKLMRQLPGRIVGATKDEAGDECFVLTLAAREQHIRREKATSNICTSASHMALAFATHMALLGEGGFRKLGAVCHATAAKAAERIDALPRCEVLTPAFFEEFVVRLPCDAEAAADRAFDADGVLIGVPVSRLLGRGRGMDDLLLVACSEVNSDADIDRLAAALGRL